MKAYTAAPDYTGNGMEMNDVSHDEPAYTLIFIAVGYNGEHFSFLNALTNRMDFRWDRWKPFKKFLQPYTFHAFLVKTFNTNTGTRQTFIAEKHIAEFGGIREARAMNAQYLEQYSRWMEFADADMATKETLKFVQKLTDFNVERGAFADGLAEIAAEHFADETFLEKLKFALECADLPTLDIEQYTDLGWTAEELAMSVDLGDD